MLKSTKRVAIFLLITSMLPIHIYAENSNNTVIDNVKYEYTISNDGVTINDVETKEYSIVIPKEIDGSPVTKIGDNACENQSFISVKIPDTVISLGNSAFNNTRLMNIIIQDGVKEIGESCFAFCKNLTSAVLPDSVIYLGANCFTNCKNLTEVNIPDNLEVLETGIFSGCESLQNITIPDNVNEINNAVFSHCTSLENIEWNKTADVIVGRPFMKTKWLENYSEDFLILNNGTLLHAYTGKTGNAVIPDTVTEVSDGAFMETDIKSVVIPKSIKIITGSMFHDCKNLTDVTIEDGITGIEDGAFSECISLKNIELPESITYIGGAFRGCTVLENINIPENVRSIGQMCFYDCKSLKKIHLPSKLESLGEKAFWGCNALTDINIPAKVCSAIKSTLIVEGNLKNVEIEGELTPELAKSLTASGWSGADGTEYFIVDNILIKYNGNADTIIIPEGVTEIKDKACIMNEAKAVVLPSTLQRIGTAAFNSMKNLTSISIPGSVTSIGAMAFGECTNLKNITFEMGERTLALGNGSFQSAAVTEESLKTEGRKYINKEQAFNNTALNPNSDKYAETPTEKPSETPSESPTTEPEKSVITVISDKDKITVKADEEEIRFTDAYPYIDENGRTQIPIRAVGESLKCDVNWNEADRTVTLTRNGTEVIITINSSEIKINGKATIMDTKAKIIGERTYIPLRFAAEALGMTVNWKTE